MRIRDYSPITFGFERLFRLLQLLPPQVVLSSLLGNRADLTPDQIESRAFTAARARRVEAFIFAYLILDSLAFAATFSGRQPLLFAGLAWVVLRGVDIVQATVNVMLFDPMRGRTDSQVASRVRLVVRGFVNFLELLVCFATVYASFIDKLKGATSPWDALYFSVITQLTIGYGDLAPLGSLRAVAAIQGLGGLAFLALVFARTIAALPPIRETFGDREDDA